MLLLIMLILSILFRSIELRLELVRRLELVLVLVLAFELVELEPVELELAVEQHIHCTHYFAAKKRRNAALDADEAASKPEEVE